MTMIVKANGEVRPCCGTDQVFGRLGDDSFGQIWNSTEYQNLRSETLEGRYPPLCAACLEEGRAPGFNLDLLD